MGPKRVKAGLSSGARLCHVASGELAPRKVINEWNREAVTVAQICECVVVRMLRPKRRVEVPEFLPGEGLEAV
jgi:hypothetical protein